MKKNVVREPNEGKIASLVRQLLVGLRTGDLKNNNKPLK